MTLLFLLGTAFAQDEVCDAIYTSDELREAITEATDLVGSGRAPRAAEVLGKARDVVHCLETLVSRDDLRAFAEVSARVAFYNQEPESALRWGQLVSLIDTEHTWAEDDPLRRVLEDADPPAFLSLDKGFVLEKKGSVFMDGAFLSEPKAYATPHLVQVFNGKGHLLKAFWQDGSAFPDELLGPSGAIERPKYYDPSTGRITPRGKPPVDLPGRDPIPPTILAGAGLVVASAGLYALAGVSHAKLTCDPREKDGCPTTPEALTKLRTRTNLLVLGSAVTFLGGVGLGVTGVLTDAPPGLRLSGRL